MGMESFFCVKNFVAKIAFVRSFPLIEKNQKLDTYTIAADTLKKSIHPPLPAYGVLYAFLKFHLMNKIYHRQNIYTV